ncbi:hypothetical protein [Bradyrhizobium australiense]|uniref:Uncharacterized protein n=1 Tax=Bradyrhizobium australiense TaxID=2721161 RepID=A0A7Y4GU03_9BRAD|nr:hypothetical protein [Bradyrhizobium australiense]NOJ41861.1 hypothetical protein [Bradyrhizobium australiense]
MASEAKLSGVPSRELSPGVPLRLAIGADGRVISVGISAALFGLSGFRHMLHGTYLSLPGHQMPVAAQYPDCIAAPRAMERLEDAHKYSLALRTLPVLVFNRVSTHR